MIADNPFATLLKVPSKASSLRPTEREAQLEHQALEQSVAALQALLGIPDVRQGPKVWELHVSQTLLLGVATAIKHGMGRTPRYLFPGYFSLPASLSMQREQWTADQVVVTADADTVIDFFLL